jgi:hypothetical protein
VAWRACRKRSHISISRDGIGFCLGTSQFSQKKTLKQRHLTESWKHDSFIQMAFARKEKPRAKPLDLVRRAKALGVTPGHLSRVISGRRESKSLLIRLDKLIQAEPRTKTKSTQANQQNSPQLL